MFFFFFFCDSHEHAFALIRPRSLSYLKIVGLNHFSKMPENIYFDGDGFVRLITAKSNESTSYEPYVII